MKMLAQNALLIYIDDIDARASGRLIRSDALDSLTSLGCNGVLISSECQTPDPSACLQALLGVSASGECAYPRMNVVFYSDHQTARKAIPERFQMIQETGDAEILECVKRSLSEGSTTLVILHLDGTHLDLLDSLVRHYVSDEVNSAQVFVSVVQNAASRMEEYVSKATISNVYRPRQSSTKVDGAYVNDNTAPQYFVLSFFQHNRIRKDDVKRYELSEFAHKNGYGSMNLRALIKEIAFRLGCTPKYGA